MFKNFIVLAYRHFVRSPLSSFIELFGMTAGLTVFLLVLLWVSRETSYDSFNEKGDRIYRLEQTTEQATNGAFMSAMIGPLLKESLPEVEKSVRFRSMGDGKSQVYTVNSNGIVNFYDAGRKLFADSDFFDSFTFEFVAGNPKTALTQKYSIVITDDLAKTIFGNKNAIGKQIFFNGNQKVTITGVVKETTNFHIPFKTIVSYETLKDHPEYIQRGGINSWESRTHSTYLMLNKSADIDNLEEKIKQTIWTHIPEEHQKYIPKSGLKYHLRPLNSIYMNDENLISVIAKQGDKKKIVAYSTIAFFTLLLACINFINLNNAKYFERIKEVGVKKVCGASRNDVFVQFLGEVALLCIFSLVLSIIFTHSVLPYFNELIDTKVYIEHLFQPQPFLLMLVGLIIICLASGGFPALYLSSFKPAMAIKGISSRSSNKHDLKKFNLVIQFSVTIILVIGSITAFRQISHMKNMDLGLDLKDHSLISIGFNLPIEKVDAIKRTLLANPKVYNVSHVGAYSTPGENRTAEIPAFLNCTFDGMEHSLTPIGADEDYKETLGLELVAGRYFERGRTFDKYNDSLSKQSIVLNQSAVKLIGLENPIGAVGKWRNKNINVIGVIKDFHLNSTNHPILPMGFFWSTFGFKLLIKISSDDIASTVEFVEREVQKMDDSKWNVELLDNVYEEQYAEDDDFASLIGSFTSLAILIACLGLLGVATHAIKLRTKEIGVRKIVGASSLEVLRLLAQPFLKNIALSSILAVPIAWVLMDKWLSNYPYRINQDWWVFAVACGLTVFVAAFTIIWQSWRASSVNPARLIRYE
ncbi:MAG: ABC transporter permease [Cyclobacteriaceae bacterium]